MRIRKDLKASRKSVALSNITQAVATKRMKCRKPFKATLGLFEDYCDTSTLHGVKYFFEKKYHKLERAWWIFAFAVALYYCGTLIHYSYMKWYQSPAAERCAQQSTPVWEIPFPAVTICPVTKADMSLLNFTEVFRIMAMQQRPPYNITDEENKLMSAVVQICASHLTAGIEVGNNFTDSSITDLLRDLAPTFNDTMFICKFRNTINDCQEYFVEVMTDEGLCFTFNALKREDMFNENVSPDYAQINHNMTAEHWNMESGYDTSIDPQAYPYRVYGSGARDSLFVLLKLYEQNLEYICWGGVQGFKILLHTPGEIPQVSKHYFRVPLLQDVLVSVKPNMIITSEELRNVEPNRRGCYFDSERKLRFLKIYTQRNCELECLANFTLQKCGCVKFSMPRDANTPICGAAKIDCYNRAEDNLLWEQLMESVSLGRDAEKVNKCNCLPACTSITYDTEISQVPFDWVRVFNAFNSPMDEFPGMQPTRLSISFKENQFSTSKRSDTHRLIDFLATCGGLLGLFIGASFLSIIELLYFFSLRLCCNFRERMIRKSKKIADGAGPKSTPEVLNIKPASDKVWTVAAPRETLPNAHVNKSEFGENFRACNLLAQTIK